MKVLECFRFSTTNFLVVGNIERGTVNSSAQIKYYCWTTHAVFIAQYAPACVSQLLQNKFRAE